MKKLTNLAVKVKILLMQADKTQEWLIGEINKRGVYCDRKKLSNVFYGRINDSNILPVIDEIVDEIKKGAV